jgi:hypothetical protein
MSKHVVQPQGPQMTSRCMLDKQGYTHAQTHTDKCIILIRFPRRQLFANAPQSYVIRTLPSLLNYILIITVGLLKLFQMHLNEKKNCGIYEVKLEQ